MTIQVLRCLLLVQSDREDTRSGTIRSALRNNDKLDLEHILPCKPFWTRVRRESPGSPKPRTTEITFDLRWNILVAFQTISLPQYLDKRPEQQSSSLPRTSDKKCSERQPGQESSIGAVLRLQANNVQRIWWRHFLPLLMAIDLPLKTLIAFQTISLPLVAPLLATADGN